MGYWPCLLVIYVEIGAGVRRKKKKKEHQGGVDLRNILIENYNCIYKVVSMARPSFVYYIRVVG